MRFGLVFLVFLGAQLPGCASQYQSDLLWCQENTFGIEQDRCRHAALRKAQRNEQLQRRR